MGVMLLLCTISFGQQMNPIQWSSATEKISDTEMFLVFTATIQPNWHLYNLQIPEGGPLPTTFSIEKSKAIKYVGDVTPVSTPIKAHDNNFDMDLEYFSDKAVFKQKINIAKGISTTVKASVNYMCCDDHQCIPPTEHKFVILVK